MELDLKHPELQTTQQAQAVEITSVRVLAGELYARAGSRLLIPCTFSVDRTHAHKISLEWRQIPKRGGAYISTAFLFDNNVDLMEQHHNQRTEFFISHFHQGNCSLVIDPLQSNDEGIYEPHIAIDGVQYEPVPSTAVFVWDNSKEPGLPPVDTDYQNSREDLEDEVNIKTSTYLPDSTPVSTEYIPPATVVEEEHKSAEKKADDATTPVPDSTPVTTEYTPPATVEEVQNQSAENKADDVTSDKVTTATTLAEEKPAGLKKIKSVFKKVAQEVQRMRHNPHIVIAGGIIGFLLFYACVWGCLYGMEKLDYRMHTKEPLEKSKESIQEKGIGVLEWIKSHLPSCRRVSCLERAVDRLRAMEEGYGPLALESHSESDSESET
ncbi:uncharacterized protein [Hyperolius riggenbachi]|uniref:uncharacterized protein n=1 Tax=Hyperolius riggenbachi TaxID=752182 RepID=UPI0035A29CF5